MKLIPSRITSLREYKELSQAELAERAEIEPSYVSKLERGKAPNVAGIVLARIASALGTSTDYLLNLTDNPFPIPSPDFPDMQDPNFARLVECYRAAGDQLRYALVDIAERAVGLPPTREVLPRTPDEYELPPGCEPDDS